MNKNLRKAVIAGNWKMNKTRPEAKALLEAIKPLVANAEGKVEVIAAYLSPTLRPLLTPQQAPTLR